MHYKKCQCRIWRQKKRRLPRDSHQGATLTQTQNKTRQNYYANFHLLHRSDASAEHRYSHIHELLQVTCINETACSSVLFVHLMLKNINLPYRAIWKINYTFIFNALLKFCHKAFNIHNEAYMGALANTVVTVVCFNIKL